MHGNRTLFYDELKKTGIKFYTDDVQRHFRIWMKSTNGEYKKMSDKEMHTSIKMYIAKALLCEPDSSLPLYSCATLKRDRIFFTQKEYKQCKALGIEFIDTLQGYYVSLENYELMRMYTHRYSSLLDLFSQKTDIDNELSMEYRDFLKRCRSKKIELIAIPFHPGSGELFFEDEMMDVVNQALVEWIACSRISNDTIPDSCISLAESSELLKIDIYTMYEFACVHKECVKTVSDYIYPLIEAVERWRSDLNESRRLLDLIIKIRKELKSISSEQAKEAVEKLITDANPEYIYTGDKLAGKSKYELYYRIHDEKIVRDIICRCFDKLSVLKISVLQPITGYSLKELNDLATRNQIKAIETSEGYFVNRNEVIRLTKLGENLINIKEVIDKTIKDMDTTFNFNSVKCREDFYTFLEKKDFWDIEFFHADDIPIKADKSIYFIKRTDEKKLKFMIGLWIESYGRSNPEKIRIMFRHYEDLYPKTCMALRVYFGSNNNSGLTTEDKAVVDMISVLLPMLRNEISEMSEEKIQDIIEQFRECSLTSCLCLTTFLFDGGYTEKRYKFDKIVISKDTSAYPLEPFALMAYSALNNESWAENQLITKAVHNKRYAALWLFITLHFLAAWRSTDFERLEAPTLRYSAIETLRQIEEGIYKEEDAKIVALRFRSQIEVTSSKPNKTANYENVPELHFFCPQSCEYPLGIILSIATAHYEINSKESKFVRCINDVRTIKEFFGYDFLKACNKRQFSTRRANKSLMQGVETISESRENKGLPRPYILASLMRSHKGGYGSLAESTAIYLRDANFSGYTPEFIAKQMFERGVCSFVANELLKISFGDEYKKLSVTDQTRMIKTIGLQAGEIERIVRICQKAEDDAIALVKDLLGKSEYKENANNTLKSILMGDAVGKDRGSLCILRASGHNCIKQDRLGCIGCTYEIKTKALLIHYIKEHSRLSKELEDKSIKSNVTESERRKHVINRIIYPAIEEIIVNLEDTITANELMEYKNIVEEALNHGD